MFDFFQALGVGVGSGCRLLRLFKNAHTISLFHEILFKVVVEFVFVFLGDGYLVDILQAHIFGVVLQHLCELLHFLDIF